MKFKFTIEAEQIAVVIDNLLNPGKEQAHGYVLLLCPNVEDSSDKAAVILSNLSSPAIQDVLSSAFKSIVEEN